LQQEDYLKKQIDQLGRVLGLALAKLLGIKNNGNIEDGVNAVSELLKSELDLDIYDLAEIPINTFIEHLNQNKYFNSNNLETLADIFFGLAEVPHPFNKKDTLNFYKRAYIIYQHLDRNTSTFSIDRSFKMRRIESIATC